MNRGDVVWSVVLLLLLGSEPWRSTSPPLSWWPEAFLAWRRLHSQPAPRPVWRTDAPSLGGFFPGASYDLWPSAARCAWRYKHFSRKRAQNAAIYSGRRLCVLLGSLSGGQGGGYRAARLGHVKELLLVSGGGDQTLVFMAPHHQVQEVIQELLRNVVRWSMFTPAKSTLKLHLDLITEVSWQFSCFVRKCRKYSES